MQDIAKVVIDCDPGPDDFIALLIFLLAETLSLIKIQAIFCSLGNSSLEYTCKNLVRTLELTNRTDIPVYKGVSTQMIIPEVPIERYYLTDGFGDLNYTHEPDVSIIRKTPSPVALNEIINKYPNEISLITLGPLTNLALALKLYPEMGDKIKDIWMMGGNGISGKGNASPDAEYNWFVDPESVDMVFQSLKKKMTILPLDGLDKSTVSYEWKNANLGIKSKLLKYFNDAVAKVNSSDEPTWRCYDAVLASSFLNPKHFITKLTEYNATMDLCDKRGKMNLYSDSKNYNVKLIEDFDVELFKEILLTLEDTY